MVVKLNTKQKDLLVYLFTAGAITIAVVNPILLTPAILFANFWDKNDDKKKFRNSFYYSKANKLIKIESENGKTKISLTKKGENKAVVKFLSSFDKDEPLNEKRKWNGKWYLVIFDITVDRKIKRDILRRYLKRKEFYLLQKSVWVYPHNCIKDINLLKEYFDISNEECRVVVASEIGDETKLKKFFKL